MIKYTPEQYDALEHIQNCDGTLLIRAGAGTGKSFMARQIVDVLKPKIALYTAFNKAIVEEGVNRFKGTNVECKTLHALAYKYVKPTKNIESLTYSCIEEDTSYSMKYQLLTAIDLFYVSASTDVYDFMEEHFKDHSRSSFMIDTAVKYVMKMVEGKLNPTFNFLLKYFHLMLHEGSVTCAYDLVILDEINDTTAVSLEIFKLIKAPKKLGLGETHQAIYQFLNLVNGFELLTDADQIALTRSFRCSDKIAYRIQEFMRATVAPDFCFVGTDDPVKNDKFLYCTLTNASIIERINDRLVAKKGFTLLRKPSDIFAAPLALITANKGAKPYQKKFAFLVDEYKNYQDEADKRQYPTFFAYLIAHVDDVEIQSAIRLLGKFRRANINLFELYSQVKDKTNSDPDYTIATVFTAKGLEFETVEIADDLNGAIINIQEKGGPKTLEDIVKYRCYYVACSRAGKTLINASMLPSE